MFPEFAGDGFCDARCVFVRMDACLWFGAYESAAGSGRESAIGEDGFAAANGAPHDTLKTLARIGAEPVPLRHVFRPQCEAGAEIDQRQIGVVAGTNGPFVSDSEAF